MRKYYEKINMAFIKIRITILDSKFTEVEKENS
jgi:hypothetical protein